MTSSPQVSLTDRLLDLVFGRRLTPEDAAVADAARPPRVLDRIYGNLLIATAFAVLILWLWENGWLPFVESRAPQNWLSGAWGANILLTLCWHLISRYYARRAKGRMSLSE